MGELSRFLGFSTGFDKAKRPDIAHAWKFDTKTTEIYEIKADNPQGRIDASDEAKMYSNKFNLNAIATNSCQRARPGQLAWPESLRKNYYETPWGPAELTFRNNGNGAILYSWRMADPRRYASAAEAASIAVSLPEESMAYGIIAESAFEAAAGKAAAEIEAASYYGTRRFGAIAAEEEAYANFLLVTTVAVSVGLLLIL